MSLVIRVTEHNLRALLADPEAGLRITEIEGIPRPSVIVLFIKDPDDLPAPAKH